MKAVACPETDANARKVSCILERLEWAHQELVRHRDPDIVEMLRGEIIGLESDLWWWGTFIPRRRKLIGKKRALELEREESLRSPPPCGSI